MKPPQLYTKKRIIIFMVISIIILSSLTGLKLYISYYATDKSARIALANQYTRIAEDIVKGLDKDTYQKFLLTKQNDNNQMAIKSYLEHYRIPIHALYVYILELDDTNVAKVMIAAIPPGIVEVPMGFTATIPPAQVMQAKKGYSYYTEAVKDAPYGSYFSIGVPFYGNNGEILGILGIDIDARDLKKVSQEVVKSNISIFGIDILFAVLLLIVAFLLRKWYKIRSGKDLKEAEKLFISELGKVMGTIKSSRHDMMNHLHVLNGLVDMKMYDRAGDYLKRLTIDSKPLQLSLSVKNPVLMVLFQSKWELAQSKNIQIQFETDLNPFERVESMDLVKIFSNLLDNAIEAVEVYSGEHSKWIRVVCKEQEGKYVFEVENPAQFAPKEKKNLFQDGYSTKDTTHLMRGNGLTIIKRIVEKYKGSIDFYYVSGKVVFQITI